MAAKIIKKRKRSLTRKTKLQLLTGTDPVIPLLIKSICEYYPNDPSMPGVLVSYLPGMQMYYVSLVRYREIYGKNPYSVMNVKNENLIDALNEFVQTWKNKIQPSKQAIESFLRLEF